MHPLPLHFAARTSCVQCGVTPVGLAAFQARKQEKSGVYSYENRPRQLDAVYKKKLRANEKA